MSIRKIAGFILTGILLSTSNILGQDTIRWAKHVRFGFDLSRIAMGEFQAGRKALEITADVEMKPNLFYTVELGQEHSARNNNRIQYKQSGIYGKLGFDYNILNYAKTKSRDILYIGARYGYYNMNQDASWYMIPNSNLKGDTITGSLSSHSLYGHWLEGVFGVKVEFFHNFYIGTSLRARFLIYSKKDVNYPYFLPGFGDGSKKATFGVTYTIYYQIPLAPNRNVIIKKPAP